MESASLETSDTTEAVRKTTTTGDRARRETKYDGHGLESSGLMSLGDFWFKVTCYTLWEFDHIMHAQEVSPSQSKAELCIG